MSDDTTKVQADGGDDGHKGEGNPQGGRTGAGESGGGASLNPEEGGDGPPDDGFLGHGGQTDLFENDSGGTAKS